MNGNGFVDRDVVPGRTYEYRVRSRNSAGTITGTSGVLAVKHPSNLNAVPTVEAHPRSDPAMAGWVRDTVRPLLQIWYPKMARVLAGTAYLPPMTIRIFIDPTLTTHPAEASGNVIRVSKQWTVDHPEDLGLYLHEATHLIQSASSGEGWMIEGAADWTREYMARDRFPRKPAPGTSYTAGYSDASYFLNWIEKTKKKTGFIRRMTVAGHDGVLTRSFFTRETGKPVDRLWAEMMQ